MTTPLPANACSGFVLHTGGGIAVGDTVVFAHDYAAGGTMPVHVFWVAGRSTAANQVPLTICNHAATTTSLTSARVDFWRLRGPAAPRGIGERPGRLSITPAQP